jgi:adenosylcobinamide-GDP ribazoletransferase
MRYFKRFVLMIQFLTTIPIRVNLNVTNEDFGKGLVFAPAVGLLLGGILGCAALLAEKVFSGYITAVLMLVLYILLTGGLHLDGLGDTFDGLFSNRSRERMLEIMRDSRVGTNAVLAIGCVLLLNTVLLSGSPIIKVLLLMPVAGRVGSVVGAGVSTYARRGEGLGKSFIDVCGWKEIVMGVLVGGIIFFAAAGVKGLVLTGIAAISALVLVKFFSRKIGGATGDILGAVCELNQTVFLLAAYLVQQYWGAL